MTRLLTFVIVMFLSGCGGAGDVGDGCDEVAVEGECAAGAICTNMSGADAVCRKVCTMQSDCAAGENCNGVSGTSTKSCQPG